MSFLRIIKNPIKQWYLILLVGVVLAGVGIWTLFFLHQSIILIATVFSLIFLLSGLFETIFVLSNKTEIYNWGWGLVFSIIKLIIGFLLLFHPAVSALTLAFCVGLIFFFHSLGAIIIAFDLKRYLILEWGNLLAIGIIGFIASVILLINPHLTSIAIVIFLGISLII